jgi:hypothetical protein
MECIVNKCIKPPFFNDKTGKYIRECKKHREVRMNKDAERRKKKRESSICMSCSQPNDGQSIYCETHRLGHSTRMKRARRDNKTNGKCVECDNEPTVTSKNEPSSRCSTHIQQQREYRNKIDRLSPEKRRHYASFCGNCGVFRVSSDRFCTTCDLTRTSCVEYKWHERMKELALLDQLWPVSSSTFTDKKAFGTLECAMEKLVYADMVWLLHDRIVVCECDEHGHEFVESECELARMDNMQFGVKKLLPLVVLRFNPHKLEGRNLLSDFDEKVASYWNRVKYYLTCPINKLPVRCVTVEYFNYKEESGHVIAARKNARFIVKTN